jgi:DNA polymerase-3 subunit gamma/tau
VTDTIGSGGRANIESTVYAISNCDYDAIFSTIDDVVSSSKDIAVFWQELLSYYRDMLVMKTTASAQRYLDLTEHESEQLKNTCALFTKETLLWHCKVIDEAYYVMKKAGSAKRIVAEMALIRICDESLDTSAEALSARISKLENAIASGTFAVAQSAYSEETQSDIPTKVETKASETEKKADKPQKAEAKYVEKPELKALRGWNEIAEKAAAGDVSLLPFLKMTKAFTDSNGKIYVRYPNTFVKNMVDSAHAEDAIVAAIRLELKTDVARENICFSILDSGEATDEFDDLII